MLHQVLGRRNSRELQLQKKNKLLIRPRGCLMLSTLPESPDWIYKKKLFKKKNIPTVQQQTCQRTCWIVVFYFWIVHSFTIEMKINLKKKGKYTCEFQNKSVHLIINFFLIFIILFTHLCDLPRVHVFELSLNDLIWLEQLVTLLLKYSF